MCRIDLLDSSHNTKTFDESWRTYFVPFFSVKQGTKYVRQDLSKFLYCDLTLQQPLLFKYCIKYDFIVVSYDRIMKLPTGLVIVFSCITNANPVTDTNQYMACCPLSCILKVSFYKLYS